MTGPSDRTWYFEKCYGPFWEEQVRKYGLTKFHHDLADQMSTTAPPGPVLEVGAGTGFPYALLLRSRGRAIVGVDLSHGLLAKGREVMTAAAGDAARLPFARERFSLVYCLRSSWYFDDLRRCIDEMMRVLAPGGVLFIDARNSLYLPNALGFARAAAVCLARRCKRRLFGQSTLGVIIESRPAPIPWLVERLIRQGNRVELSGLRGERWLPLRRGDLLTLSRHRRVIAVVRKGLLTKPSRPG